MNMIITVSIRMITANVIYRLLKDIKNSYAILFIYIA